MERFYGRSIASHVAVQVRQCSETPYISVTRPDAPVLQSPRSSGLPDLSHVAACYRLKPFGSGLHRSHGAQARVVAQLSRHSLQFHRIDRAPVPLQAVRAGSDPFGFEQFVHCASLPKDCIFIQHFDERTDPVTEQEIDVYNDWAHDFWAGWFKASDGRADEEHVFDLAREHYVANQHRPGGVVAAELYALDPLPPIDKPPTKFIYPDDVPF